MPKPPPLPQIEDDSKYLTIVHPYPLNADLRLPADRRTLALWLACCTGKDVLRAMYHKPTSAGMIIVEVDREVTKIEDVLGMHSWSEFLLAPAAEEAGKSSEVFFCTYNTNKDVKNGGWNRVDIEEHWFQGWRPENDAIKFPYPKPAFCDVPLEPKTGVPMCRPLPRRFFPTITSESPSTAHAPSTVFAVSHLTVSPASVSPITDRRTQQETRTRVPPFTFVASNPVSNAPKTVVTRQGSSTYPVRASAPPPATPLGLAPPPGLSVMRMVPRSGTYPRPETSQVPARRWRGPTAVVRVPQVSDHRDENTPMSSTAVALADHFGSAPGVASVTNGGIPSGIDEGTETHGNNPARDLTRVDDEVAIVEKPWDGYDAARADPPIRVKKRGDEEWICPVHGPTCTPKICKALGRVESDERRKKEQEERDEKRKIWREKKESKAQRKAQKAADVVEVDDVSRDQGPLSQVESPGLDPPLSSATTHAPLLDAPPSAATNIRAATTSPIPVVPAEGGFPTFSGTDWADPIVAAQASVAGAGADASKACGGGIKAGRNPTSGRGNPRRAPSRGRERRASSSASGTSRSAQVSEPEVEILPGDPGARELWEKSDTVW